jgi:hypothetical protein
MEELTGLTDNKELMDRIANIKERLERLHIKGASYKIGRGSRQRSPSPQEDKQEDSHAVHLLPRITHG